MQDHRNKSSLGVHFFYVTLILVATLVLVSTFKWTELPKFTDYLSTAATITSLVLGLLAIIYAYISNDSLSQATGVVNEAAHEAQQATLKISELIANVDVLAGGSRYTNEQLSQLVSELKDQLQSLERTADVLDDQASAISSVLPEIPKGLQSIEKRFEEFAQAPPASTDQKPTGLAQKEIEIAAKSSIGITSPAGVFLMLACYLSMTTGKEFDVKTFTKFTDADYFWGFFQALSAYGIIQHKRSDPKVAQIVKIVTCPNAYSQCQEEFERRIEKQGEETKARWKSSLNELLALFNQTPG